MVGGVGSCGGGGWSGVKLGKVVGVSGGRRSESGGSRGVVVVEEWW